MSSSIMHFAPENETEKVACGRKMKKLSSGWTSNREGVSCDKCKATRVFKNGLEPQDSEDLASTLERKNYGGLKTNAFKPTRVDPPLVLVTWETFSDFLLQNPNATAILVAKAVDFGDRHGLETWIDVRTSEEFYWKSGSDL